jgi:hypothetical protein
MGYSETQFQRELLKALNKISSELHESNVLAKESVAMQKRMLQINEASSHQMSIEELKIMREADAMMGKQEEERYGYTMINKYDLEKFNAESEDNKEQ